MQPRSVAHILPAHTLDMGGTQVKQPLPTQRVDQVDPFLLLHHFGPTTVEPGGDPLDVGPHPHRGFEPVTFLYSGGIRHHDSRGNTGELRGGDVQWMTAGMGIIHSERASREFLEQGGTLEGIQLWVNLPAAKKMMQPNYQDLKAADIPALDGRGYRIRIVAGELDGVHGPAVTQTTVNAWQVKLDAEGHVALAIPPDHNALLYILSGQVQLNNNFDYGAETGIHFRNDGDGITLTGLAEASRVLVLTGAPIGEPVARWGPYVMNTQTEILEAMRDYRIGKMGVYIEG